MNADTTSFAFNSAIIYNNQGFQLGLTFLIIPLCIFWLDNK